MNVGVVVEGHGEETAVPLLLRRLASWLAPDLALDAVHTVRLSRHKMIKDSELHRAVELLARRCGPAAPIIVLLDADDDPA